MRERLKQLFEPLESKEFFRYVGVYLVLALINLRVKMLITDVWRSGILERNHRYLLSFEFTNNEQSRLLQFLIPEALRRIFHLTVPQAYVIQRWGFVFLAFVGFHFYLRKWFDERGSFTAVLLLAAVMPITYQNHLQESAPLLLFTFLMGLWTIREHRDLWFTVILAVGALNNETILCLPFVYFCYNWKRFEVRHLLRLAAATVGRALPAFLLTAQIRYINRNRPHLGGAWHLPENVEGVLRSFTTHPADFWSVPYLNFILVFGMFWYFAARGFRSKPLFLRRASYVIPIFILIHFITGVIHESRQMLPLSFIVIPLGLHYLFNPPSRQMSDSSPDP